MRKSKGFTLIELMIIVGIIGILILIAMPSYREYVARARVAEGLTLTADFRQRYSDYITTNHHFLPYQDDNGIKYLGYSDSELERLFTVYPPNNKELNGMRNDLIIPVMSHNVIGYSPADDGILRVYYYGDIIDSKRYAYMLKYRPFLMKSGQVIWICGDKGLNEFKNDPNVILAGPTANLVTPGNIPSRFLPPVCR